MASQPEVKFKFAAGATDTVRRYALTQNGSAKDLTGFSAVKLFAERRSDGTAVAAISGSIVSPATGGLVDVDHVTIAATEGAYLCELETTDGAGKKGYSDEPFLTVVRPRVQSIPV